MMPRLPVASTIINFGISWTILFGLVIGSGVLPVSLPLLAIIALTLSIVIASVSYIAENWKIRWPVIIALGALSLFLSVVVFMMLVDGGLRKAKSYAKSLALEIEAVRRDKSAWPAKLKEIPIDRRPQVAFSERWPYDYQEEDGLYDKVGGFFIDYYYHVQLQEPKLAVVRRDIRVNWDWKEMRWENSPGWLGKD